MNINEEKTANNVVIVTDLIYAIHVYCVEFMILCDI